MLCNVGSKKEGDCGHPQALNSFILEAQPFWPQDFSQKYGTKAIVKGHQGHTKRTGFVFVLYLPITSE